MSERLYLITIGLVPLTVLLVYAMRYYSAYLQTKTKLANDDAYRELAQNAVKTQTETQERLAAVDTTLQDLKARITKVEAKLKSVE